MLLGTIGTKRTASAATSILQLKFDGMPYDIEVRHFQKSDERSLHSRYVIPIDVVCPNSPRVCIAPWRAAGVVLSLEAVSRNNTDSDKFRM